ncbi:MAG: hypothetical protein A2Z17_01640 [Gammaproteobacteria bacterium RBG_16_66_13]|nr:MAG: hypothetical protein A2Z17_01640 [Gammaproteobacteria bacterium RBG_16_66_13]
MPKAKGRFVARDILKNARKLRHPMTPAELALWRRVRDGQLGVKIRRQHPVGRYIADFYCPRARLVIEVDGDIHVEPDRARHDAERTSWLEARGYRILRFMNADVF